MLCLFLICIGDSSQTLVKHHDRTGSFELSESLKTEIRKETEECYTDPAYTDKLMKYSLDKTAEILQFSKKNSIAEGRANCVGYARLCAAIFNYGCKLNGLKSYAKPVVGHIEIVGFDLNIAIQKIATPEMKNFLKDHDFVEFHFIDEAGECGEYADPCLHDYVGYAAYTSF